MIGKEARTITEEDIPLMEILNKISVNHVEQSIHLERSIRSGKLMLQKDAEKDNFKTVRETCVE